VTTATAIKIPSGLSGVRGSAAELLPQGQADRPEADSPEQSLTADSPEPFL